MGLQTRANPYPNGNFALMLDFLEELITIVGKEKGLVAVSEENQGYEDIIYSRKEIKRLNPPKNAVSATIMIEKLADSKQDEVSPEVLADGSILIRFKENGSNPGEDSGFGLGHNDIYELVGATNLRAFRAINIAAHVALRVQYYQTGQRILQAESKGREQEEPGG
ncbi:hypothetical protein QQ008_07760 [Fulvivirgaceae bacterium BMA10]|uniref:Uncharacterized protein n=1 Tax=Splendidivirga corallicola TaxID=3051826 RepID=A0ABT8KKK8_9BACT|nr:hypothetical protein [Fulvivirgaceae bacterium BMA10]